MSGITLKASSTVRPVARASRVVARTVAVTVPALVLAGLLAGQPAFAAVAPPTKEAAVSRLAPPPAASPTAPVQADWAGLARAAGSTGSVRVIVGLRRPAVAPPGLDRAAQLTSQRAAVVARLAHGAARVHGPEGAPFMTLTATTTDLAVLKGSREVSDVTVDGVSEAQGTSSFGDAGGQQLPSMWDVGRIGADWSNANGWTGTGMKVAVIDTGVDATNPYLSGRVVNEACFARYSDSTGACNNGGFWQYATTAGGVPGSAAPCTYDSGCAHGTHVAHTAAGMYGVARAATVVGIRAAHKEWSSKDVAYKPLFNDSDLLNALWYVHDVLPKAGIVVSAVNMSIGMNIGATGTCDARNPQITSYVTALRNDYQIPTVISTGNDNDALHVSWPACISTAVAVGNSTLTSATTAAPDAVFGYAADGSNSSQVVDLLAPGTDICSAVPKAVDYDGTADGWQCGWTGTSMAAPHVAGAIAVLTQKRPTATVTQLVSRLAASGSTGGVAVTDSRNNITRTRINVANAVYYF